MPGARVAAKLAADFQAVDAGHHQVEHDQIGDVFLGDLQPALAVFGDDDFVAIFFEVELDELEKVGFVVDHEDGAFIVWWHGGSAEE